MSQGVVIQQLSTTTSSQLNELLLANNILNTRIKSIRKKYEGHPNKHLYTVLNEELKKTHTNFIGIEYRPSVYITNEYFYFNPSSGSMNLSSETLSTYEFEFVKDGDFINNQAIEIEIDSITAPDGFYIKYCDFPGIKLINNIELKFNGTTFDTLRQKKYIMYHNFLVKTDSYNSWYRMMGQSVPQYAYYDNLQKQLKDITYVSDGYQTYKKTQDKLCITIPLLFWYNLDPSESLENYNLSIKTTKILAHINGLKGLLFMVDSNGNEVPLSIKNVKINKMRLKNNCYFLPKDVLELYRSFTNKYLQVVRVNTYLVSSSLKSEDSILLNKTLKYPTENIMFGFYLKSDENTSENWYKFTKNVANEYCRPTIKNLGPFPLNHTIVASSFKYYDYKSIIDNMSITTNGEILYKEDNDCFYASYLPFVESEKQGSIIKTSEDKGCKLVNWKTINYSFNTSGYYDFSQLKETYLNYKIDEKIINDGEVVELIICGTAINLIQISREHAQLKFIT